MAFISKTDYFDLADGTMLDIISSDDGASASITKAKGQDGSIIASMVYGATISPSCEYSLKTAWAATGQAALKLGATVTTDDVVCVLSEVAIGTSAGAPPTVSASGEKVSGVGSTYTVPAFTLAKSHHAQILFSAFTLSGDGCSLTSANYTCSCGVSKALKEGECLTHDVVEGEIECAVTIVQTGSTVPTLTAGAGWTISSPLACSNPDSDYPTWSATLVKFLSKDTQS